MSTNYLFSLKIAETELKIGGDKEFVESYLEKWLPVFKGKLPEELSNNMSEEISGVSTNNNSYAAAPPRSRKLSIAEFLKSKAPKNYNDLLLTVFFYLERYEGLENIGVEFKQAFNIANKIPPNPSEEEIQSVVDELVEHGFLTQMSGTTKYQVSFSGEQCVKQGFHEEVSE